MQNLPQTRDRQPGDYDKYRLTKSERALLDLLNNAGYLDSFDVAPGCIAVLDRLVERGLAKLTDTGWSALHDSDTRSNPSS